jgi:2-iminobutanoate/2-iminopropanoate deaminase
MQKDARPWSTSLVFMTSAGASQTTSKLPLRAIVRVPAGDLLFVSGQIADRSLLSANARTQMVSVCNTLVSILASEGRTLQHVIRVGVFLADMADFAAINDAYREFFADPYPARTTVAVQALPFGALVEMDAIAR